MLKDDRKDHQRVALRPAQRKLRGADAEIGVALQHFVDRIAPVLRLHEPDVEAFPAVIALLERDVVARELELVLPVQLQRHRLESVRVRRWRRGGEREPRREQYCKNYRCPDTENRTGHFLRDMKT